jgi:hypothetical protein
MFEKLARLVGGDKNSKEGRAEARNAKSCHDCGAAFSTLARPHLCRLCGRAFCSNCSRQSVPAPLGSSEQWIRVCNFCECCPWRCYGLLQDPHTPGHTGMPEPLLPVCTPVLQASECATGPTLQPLVCSRALRAQGTAARVSGASGAGKLAYQGSLGDVSGLAIGTPRPAPSAPTQALPVGRVGTQLWQRQLRYTRCLQRSAGHGPAAPLGARAGWSSPGTARPTGLGAYASLPRHAGPTASLLGPCTALQHAAARRMRARPCPSYPSTAPARATRPAAAARAPPAAIPLPRRNEAGARSARMTPASPFLSPLHAAGPAAQLRAPRGARRPHLGRAAASQ